MRKLKLNVAIAVCVLPSLFYAQDWTNSDGTAVPDFYRTGRIGTGTWYKSGDPATLAWFSPAHGPQLEASDNTALGSTTGENSLIASFSSQCGSGGSYIRNNKWSLRNGNGTPGWSSVNLHDGISIDDQFKTPGINTLTWWERNPYSDIQTWGNNGTTYMSLTHGRLGVNWGGANARLDLNEGDNNYAALIARSSHTNDYQRCVYASVSRDLTMAFSVGNNNYGGQANNWKGTFVVYGNGKTQIGVQGPDPVGTHRDAMLSVDGKVLAKSFYVTIAPGIWADYVFDKNYKRMSINETESFVKANKHLPGIQSAKEIEESGINLAETNIKLLEKLEEAYLYIIELNKRVEILEAKNK